MSVYRRIAALEKMVARMMMPGIVREVDHDKGVRVEIYGSETGEPTLSSWVQPPDSNVGVSTRILPRVGSQVLLMTPAGNERHLTFAPLGPHESSPNPAEDVGQTVLYDDGQCRIQIGEGKITLRSGSSEVIVEDGRVQINGDDLRHNEKNVGDSHRHEEVISGGDISGVPVT